MLDELAKIREDALKRLENIKSEEELRFGQKRRIDGYSAHNGQTLCRKARAARQSGQ